MPAIFVPVPDTDVDFKSPMDEALWFQMRDNDNYLYENLNPGGGSGTVQWKINGLLSILRDNISISKFNGYMLDGMLVNGESLWTKCRLSLKNAGTSGKTRIDIKRHLRPGHALTSIDYQFAQTTQSIARLGTALATQAISLRTATVSTLSITRTKAQLNIQDIISLGSSLWRVNLEPGNVLDSDWKVGKTVVISGATNGTNNKSVVLTAVNDDGHNGFTFTSATGVQELASPAVVNLQMFTYTYTNPVDANGFVAGEQVLFAAHTTGTNNGLLTIVRINDAGNNIIVDNPTGATQVSTPGTAQTTRWVYTFLAAVLTTDYFVGEYMQGASHTTGANNGWFVIRAINDGGNNIVVTNTAGVVQGGVAGNVQTLRWIYTFSVNPSTYLAVGDSVAGFSHASNFNDSMGVVKELNRLGLNNLIVIDTTFNKVAQASAGTGVVRSEKMVLSFSSDRSASYVVDRSLVTIKNAMSVYNNETYLPVTQINRGGGANYNIVVKNPNALTQVTSFAQLFAKGHVDYESRSLFSTPPELVSTATEEPIQGGSGAVFYNETVPDSAMVSIDIFELPLGSPVDLTINLS